MSSHQKEVGHIMTLNSWIKKTGPKKVAAMLQVDQSAVSLWRTGKSHPSVESMFLIHRASKGKVTYKSMIENRFKN